MSEELKAALARIACLEGEIAKRDETIARLEPQLNRAIQANYDLREELAACRIAVENCDLFRARIAELEADRDSHQRCAIQAMAELAAIKAQDTVGEVVGWYRLDRPYEMTPYPSVCATWHRLGAPVAPLYAAHAQQVIVPGISRLLEALERVATLHIIPPYTTPQSSQLMMLKGIADQALESYRAAAPAADAGLVDALGYQVLFDAIAAATSVYANGAINISVQAFRESLAAHSAEGVV